MLARFQIYKLGFEEAEESEIKLPTYTGSWRKQEFQKNIHFSFILGSTWFYKGSTLEPLTVDHSKLWKILRWE